MALYNKIRPNSFRPLMKTWACTQHHSFTSSSVTSASRVSDAVIKDHRELENYFNRIISSKDLTEQTEYQNQFTWELARHSVGEELVVYPAFEKHLKDGVRMADKDRREHQSVRSPSLPFPPFPSLLSKHPLGQYPY